MGAAGEAQHILGNVGHVFGAPQRCSHGRHVAGTTLDNGVLDDVRRTATQPVLVGQVREALATASVRAMALRAVVHEQALANGHGLRVCCQLLRRHAVELCIQRLDFLVARRNFFVVLTRGTPGKLPLEGAGTGVHHQIGQGKDDGNHKQPHPPSWQGIVHFAQITIPHMPGGIVVGRHRLGLAAEPQQQRAGQNAHDGDAADV